MQTFKTPNIPAWVAAFVVAAIGMPVQAEKPTDILIVANKNVGQEEIDEDEVRAIFLREKHSWSSGQMIVPVNAKPSTELRKQFQNFVIEMSPSAEASYLTAQKIRHGIAPPVEFPNPLKAVFSLKGAISYVYRKDFKEGVAKVLLVVPSRR